MIEALTFSRRLGFPGASFRAPLGQRSWPIQRAGIQDGGWSRFSRRAPSATGHQQPEVQPEYNCHSDRCGEKVAVDEIHQLHPSDDYGGYRIAVETSVAAACHLSAWFRHLHMRDRWSRPEMPCLPMSKNKPVAVTARVCGCAAPRRQTKERGSAPAVGASERNASAKNRSQEPPPLSLPDVPPGPAISRARSSPAGSTCSCCDSFGEELAP